MLGRGGQALGLALLGAAVGAVLVGASSVLGPTVALLPLIAVIGLVLVRHPGWTLGVLVVTTLLFENDTEGFLSARNRWWDRLPGLVSPSDLLLMALVAGVALQLAGRRERPALPGPLTFPLLLVAVATLAGLVNGYFGGGGGVETANSARNLAYLVVIPFLVAHVLRDRHELRVAAVVGVAIVGVKGLEGTLTWLAGAGRPLGDTTLTFYSSAPNFVLMLLMLAVLAAVLSRAQLPPWALGAGLVSAVALMLSFRRSFWIAAVLGILLVFLLVRGPGGRRSLVPLVGLVTAAFVLAVAVGGTTRSQSAVVERARSLSPSEIRATKEDRYRLAEQRNVVAEIRAHPITGLGLGVPWTASEPLPTEYDGGREYTHVVVFWWWLKLGFAGVLAYLWLMAAAIFTAYRVARLHPDVLVKAGALGAVAALFGLMVAETTGSFTAVELRLTIVLAVVLGWLAVARADAAREGGSVVPHISA